MTDSTPEKEIMPSPDGLPRRRTKPASRPVLDEQALADALEAEIEAEAAESLEATEPSFRSRRGSMRPIGAPASLAEPSTRSTTATS